MARLFWRRRRYYGGGYNRPRGTRPQMAKAPDPQKLIKKFMKQVANEYKLYIRDGSYKHLVDAIVVHDSISRMGIRFNKRSADFAKLFDVAGKCRARALSTEWEGERETSLLMALRRMEKLTTFDAVPSIDAFLAKKEAKQKAIAERAAARAAAKAAGVKLPRAPRQPRAPKTLTFGVSPYRKNSALGIAWEFMHSDYHSKAELLALVNGKAKHPDFVVATLFKDRRNREPGAAWVMEADPMRPDYFKLVPLPGTPKP